MKTKYNFNKQKFCENLTEEKLKDLGFTNHYKPHWFFSRIINGKKSKKGNYGSFTDSICVIIDLNNMSKSNVEILDDAFCQPCIPLVEYYLNEKTFESLTSYCQEAVKNCDEIIKWLINNNVIYFEK